MNALTKSVEESENMAVKVKPRVMKPSGVYCQVIEAWQIHLEHKKGEIGDTGDNSEIERLGCPECMFYFKLTSV